MAEIQPLHALHYETSVAGSLADVTSPPYDVIDPQQREQLLRRSPFNVAAVDLPKEGPDGRDAYAVAADLFESWQLQGAVVRDSQPAIWAHTQRYTGPDGQERVRKGFFCAVRIEGYGPGRVRPHERTHPGPKEDRLRLMRATRANLSPIFSLFSDPAGVAWRALEPATAQAPWGEVTDGDGTVHSIWRITDPQAIAAIQAATRDAELLIADGHHRYETANTYAQEIGGEGAHNYVLMCLVALEDPGLTVFPTHRLVRGLSESRRQALREALQRDFEVQEVPLEQIAPEPGTGPLQLGYIDSHHQRPLRLTLRSQQIADAALPGFSDAYRQLDTGVLEALLLKGALGISDDDISHLNDFWYARSTEEAVSLVRTGEYEAAFLMRPTPVSQVRDVAASGENMPPKSTFFYPKLLTGLLFNPLA
ncbi:MAG: DUF1015 domain-containing protein [Solirubrobacteraceae bacterium]